MKRKSIAERLNDMAVKDCPSRQFWLTKMSVSCQQFVQEAGELFTRGELNVVNVSQFHRHLEQVIREDYPKDLAKWPRDNQFRVWIRRLAENQEEAEPKPKRKPTVRKR